MKKLIIVIMALITIFSASVTVYGSSVEWQVLDVIYNAEFNSRSCTLCEASSSRPYLSPNMVDSNGILATQETTYNLLYSLYEHLTLNGVSFTSNIVTPSVVQWYEYGGYCWILVHIDEDAAIHAGKTGVVSNYAAKMLYCEAPDTGYTVSMIAGAGGYYLTNRPVGTSGNGYLGDLKVSYDNWSNIMTRLNDLNDNTSYYTFLYSVNGEMRYHIASLIGGTKYFVCNSSGQIFYYIKEDADSGGSGSGSSFDATEVITAINSVYDAVDIGFYSVCRWLDAIQDNISSFNTDVLIMSQNMTNGFSDLRNVGNTINSTLSTINSNLLYTGDNITSSFDTFRTRFEDYFESLGKSYPVLTTVKLSGNDNLFMWSADDIITDFSVSSATDIGNFVVYRGFHYNDAYGPLPGLVNVFNASDGYTFTEKLDTPIEITCVAPNIIGYDNYNRYVNYNWCGNGDFRSPKNSSGQIAYSSNGGTINGWYLSGASVDDVTLTVKDGYVNYSVAESSSYHRMYYPLSIDYEVGKTYTLSAVVRVNNLSDSSKLFLRMGNGDGPLSGVSGYSVVVPFTSHFALVSTTVTITTSDFTDARIEFLLGNGVTCDIDILAVKLERAGYQSLAFLAGRDHSDWHLYTDVYIAPAPVIQIDQEKYTLSTQLSFMGNSHDKIFYNSDLEKWQVYRYLSKESFDLPASDQEIMNKTLSESAKFVGVKLSSLDADSAVSMFYDGVNTIDVSPPAVVTISYYHTGTWFEYVYFMMDKLYERIGQVDGAVVNIENTVVDIENTVVDIVQDNDAFNIFYVEKTDGTTESVGDVTIDAAKFVGEFLSIFYRLVFEDAFSNADIMHDFEDVYTDNNVGVSVW